VSLCACVVGCGTWRTVELVAACHLLLGRLHISLLPCHSVIGTVILFSIPQAPSSSAESELLAPPSSPPPPGVGCV